MKNCVRNEDGVNKMHAMATFDETMALAVRHRKMTQERKQELLDKIKRVACNDVTAFFGTKTDIRVSKCPATGDIIIDMFAHFVGTNDDKTEDMNVSYAAAYCTIANATLQQSEKVENLVRESISTTLKGMDMPGGDAERAQV